MIRVCTVAIEGYEQPFKVKSLTCSQAATFVKESKEMIARQEELPANAWIERIIKTVQENILFEEGKSFIVSEELDLSTVNVLYARILEFSGLKSGEATAASASPKSDAA